MWGRKISWVLHGSSFIQNMFSFQASRWFALSLTSVGFDAFKDEWIVGTFQDLNTWAHFRIPLIGYRLRFNPVITVSSVAIIWSFVAWCVIAGEDVPFNHSKAWIRSGHLLNLYTACFFYFMVKKIGGLRKGLISSGLLGRWYSINLNIKKPLKSARKDSTSHDTENIFMQKK